MSNLLNYTAYNFEDLVQQLQDRLKSKEAWIDVYRSGTGEMLIELLAYVLNLGLYYTERRAEESFLPTAQLRSSVRNIVQLLNYSPKRKTSATGNLTFTLPGGALDPQKIVYIPKYTVCESVDGVKFLTNEYAAIQKGKPDVEVSSIQGELRRLEISSNGAVNQEYIINSTSIENSASTVNPTLRVIVDGVEWTRVSSFISSLNIDHHYRVIDEMDDTVTIRFGDNINGAIPGSGVIIIVQYIESKGVESNTSKNKIRRLSSTIYDEDGTAITVDVNNDDALLGGDDEENIEEIRYEAPRVFKTGDRAVCKEDFIAILENYPGVANANVWGENEVIQAGIASGDLEEDATAAQEMLNIVKMCILLQDWEEPGDIFKKTLSAYIYDISMLTVKYEFVDPVKLLIIPVLDVKVTEGYSMSDAQAVIETIVKTKFVLGDTTKLGTIVKYSEIISAIHDLADVAYVSMVLEIKKDLSANPDSFHDWGATLDALDIKPETVRLFVDGEHVTTDIQDAVDSDTGTFDHEGITGDIDYTTGVITLDDISGSDPEVYVRYQQDENDNIIPTFKQICKLEDIDVDSISME